MRIKTLFLLACTCNIFIFHTCSAQYFQQEVNYKIDVTLNDKRHSLSASETIIYKNNSQQALTELYFHLWPNAYKNRETALCKQLVKNGETELFFASEDERGFIDSLDFRINQQPIQWMPDSQHIDICKLILNEPLQPGMSAIITTPFYLKLPSAKFSRLGHLDQAYMITQWFPKPAVFDQLGWHAMPYLNQGEFFSEFGSFEVNITLPANYIVAATGDLQNSEELQFLEQKALETSKISSFTNDMSFPRSDNAFKTLTYKQDNVHDFAWFADKRYHVLKGEVELPSSKRKVTLWSMFTNSEPELWSKSIEYMHDAIDFYSSQIGEYPYNQVTAVDGTISAGTGMEYPNVTVIGQSFSPFMLEVVITHEIGHNWFYGMLGNNERMNGWMDEGINSYYEMQYVLHKYPPHLFGNKNEMEGIGIFGKLLGADQFDYKAMNLNEYLFSARTWNNQPLNLPSTSFTEINYGVIMYKKTAIVFDYLKEVLGDSLFKKCMQNYFSDWKFKHPSPVHLRSSIEGTSGRKLNWFFDDLISTNKKVDYKICKVGNEKDSIYNVTLKNNGSIASPVTLSAFYGLTDVNHKNNFIRTNGLFKKTEPLKLKFFSGIEQPRFTEIYFSPVIGWNNYDKFMPGIIFHNTGIIPKQVEYTVMPMYGINTNSLNGSASLSYQHYFSEQLNLKFNVIINHYNIGKTTYSNVDPQQTFFYGYTKIQPDAELQFRKNATADITHKIILKNYFVTSDNVFVREGNSVTQSSENAYYNELIYRLDNKRTLDPLDLSANLQTGEEYMKTSIEANYNFSYKKRRKGISLRFFTGSFIYYKTDANVNFRMSAFNGFDDYLFNEIYFARTETDNSKIGSRQFAEYDGAFKVNTAVGQTDKWIASLNIKITVPGLPAMLYTDFGTYSNAKNAYEGSKALMYNGGIGIWLIRDVAEVYFPLFYSSDISKNLSANSVDKFGERIRFQLNFNLMNPLKLQRQLFNQ